MGKGLKKCKDCEFTPKVKSIELILINPNPITSNWIELINSDKRDLVRINKDGKIKFYKTKN